MRPDAAASEGTTSGRSPTAGPTSKAADVTAAGTGALGGRVWGVLLATLALRLVWAAGAPLANDEAYYWDWARLPQLSYLDHPPGVAWLAAIGQALGAPGPLSARLAVPFVHLCGTLLLLRCLPLLTPQRPLGRRAVWALLALTEVVPAFSLEGVLLLPDSGLVCALAAALYASLRLAAEARPRWRWTLAAGVSLGLAGLFKYHAAPLALGLGGGVLLTRPAGGRAALFWRSLVPAAGVAALVTLPVWVWNAGHDLASLRFQGAHGFADLAASPLAAARVFLGQAVILSPLYWWGAGALALGQLRPLAATRSPRLVPVLGFLPLALLLTGLAFGKQLLPHWIAPGYWLMAPAYALRLSERWVGWRWPLRWNLAFAALLSYAAPWVLAVAPLRHALVASFSGRPGPLAELTLWEPLAAELGRDEALRQATSALAPTLSCPAPIVASLRWFWTAQLAYNLPGQPRVYSLDFNHPSYYAFRDRLADLAGCPVVVIGDRRHLDLGQLAAAVAIERQLEVVVPSHADTAVVAVLGHLRGAAELAALKY